MTNRTMISVAIMILGLLIITIPIYIFPVCSPMEMMSNATNSRHVVYKFMKCHWTAQAELGIGLVVLALGLLMFFIKSTLVRLGICLSLIFVAILAAAIPTVLIGICTSELMPCHIGTLPALLLVSGLLFIITVINAIYLKKISLN